MPLSIRPGKPRFAAAIACGLAVLAGCGGGRSGPQLVDEAISWPLPDGGGQLAGAEKRRADAARGAAVLFFMGATTPSSVAFDLPVPGYSWMEHLAQQGYRVFRWDPTGFGDSSDPPELDQPPNRNHPSTRTVVVEPEAEIVADDVAQRSGDDALHVICWSAGCAPALAFAATRPERVESLVLYAATFGTLSPLGLPPVDPDTAITNFVGAYRLTSRDDVAKRWDEMIPVDDKTVYREAAVFDEWVNGFLASDATSAERDPASVRVPNGMLADSYDLILGHPPYHAAGVTARALAVRGADDPETSARGSQQLLDSLGSTSTRYVEIAAGTHYVEVERTHLELWDAVDGFLAAD